MSKNEIDKLAALGSQSEEQLRQAEAIGRADLTLTALAVAIHVLSKSQVERARTDLPAMRLMFHELAGEDGDLWQERARYLVDGESPPTDGTVFPVPE
jgi:hypothetical protein